MPSPNGRVNGHGQFQTMRPWADREVRQGDSAKTPWGWSANRFWVLSFVLCALVSATDAILGHRVILIGFLIVGPCCAVFTGQWSRVGLAGVWAVGLALVLGVPDGIWGTATQLAFLSAVVVVAVVSTVATAVAQRVMSGR